MEHIDAILILGHRLEPDDRPSEDQVRRIDCAVEHWKATKAPMIMPCGGLTPGHAHTEAEVMRDLLIARGVPQDVIHLEDRSRITIENVRNALALLGEGKRVALVTSDYHVERALEDCRRAGLNAYGVGAVTPEGPYRDKMYAEERRIAAELQKIREKGLTDQEIAAGIVSRMESVQKQKS